jgi:hypothetical protein
MRTIPMCQELEKHRGYMPEEKNLKRLLIQFPPVKQDGVLASNWPFLFRDFDDKSIEGMNAGSSDEYNRSKYAF